MILDFEEMEILLSATPHYSEPVTLTETMIPPTLTLRYFTFFLFI